MAVPSKKCVVRLCRSERKKAMKPARAGRPRRGRSNELKPWRKNIWCIPPNQGDGWLREFAGGLRVRGLRTTRP